MRVDVGWSGIDGCFFVLFVVGEIGVAVGDDGIEGVDGEAHVDDDDDDDDAAVGEIDVGGSADRTQPRTDQRSRYTQNLYLPLGYAGQDLRDS